MKLKYFLATFAIFSIFSIPASAISDEQSGAISQHCASIKQNLKNLQRTDARTRSYLGISYENFLSNFISPLNLRLINNSKPSANLTNIHSELISARQSFVSQYTTYSQKLEDLINTDCKSQPETFYEKLQIARDDRNTLHDIVIKIRDLLDQHYSAVLKVKVDLGEKKK